MGRSFSEEEIVFIKDNFPKLSLLEISDRLKRSRSVISKKILELNLRQKHIKNGRPNKNNYLTNFFENPNLLNSYYAGLIAADGNVRYDEKKYIYRLQLGFHEKDINHLLKFKEDVKFDGPLYYRREKKIYSLELKGKKIINDIINNFNIVPAKSLILKPPIGLSFEQKMAFTVGYIDGDGCIYHQNKKYPHAVYLLGTKELLTFIKNVFDELEPLHKHKNAKIDKKRKTNIYRFNLSGQRAHKILQKLKSINVPKLERKWDRV